MSDIRKAHAAARRQRLKKGLVAGAVVWLVGTAGAVAHKMDPIGQKLEVRSSETLAAEGYPGLEIDFDGREGRVSGVVARETTVEAARADIESVVGGIYGVRSVDVSAITVGAAPSTPKRPSAPVATATPTAVMATTAGKVELRGVLKTQARVDATVASAKQAFGADNVVNRLTVSPQATDPRWVGGLPRLASAMKGVAEAGFNADGKSLTLSGWVDNPAQRQAVVTAAKAATPGLAVVDKLRVREAPVLTMASSGKHITLTGTVPSEAAKVAAGTQASAVFGADRITNNLTVDPRVQAPGWLTSIWDVFPKLTAVRAPGLATKPNGGLVLTGTVNDDPTRQTVGDAVAQACPELKVDNQLMVKEAVQEANDSFAELMREVQGKGIYFETASAEISAPGAKHLDKVVRLLEVIETIDVLVVGHTDSVGKTRSNLKLSRERAVSVRGYLTDRGIDPKRLRAKGYGEARPVASNQSEGGRSQNRRIDFVVQGK